MKVNEVFLGKEFINLQLTLSEFAPKKFIPSGKFIPSAAKRVREWKKFVDKQVRQWKVYE